MSKIEMLSRKCERYHIEVEQLMDDKYKIQTELEQVTEQYKEQWQVVNELMKTIENRKLKIPASGRTLFA